MHGVSAVQKAEIATPVLYESDYTSVKASDVLNALSGDPRLKITSDSELFGTSVARLAVHAKLISSNCKYFFKQCVPVLTNSSSGTAEARRLVSSKGLYLNNVPIEDFQYTVTQNDLLDGKFVVVRAGSQKQLVLAIT